MVDGYGTFEKMCANLWSWDFFVSHTVYSL